MNAPHPPPAATLGWTWSNVDPVVHFAANYAEARAKFRAAASARGITVESHEHPAARGPSGEALGIDVAVMGDAKSRSMLLITSGTHGAEGYCGSGCQVGLLADDAFLASVKQRGVAVVMLHALNPFGFAHTTRTNEDNVDLNRNFRDFGARVRNDAYLEVHEFIVPSTWPPSGDNEARIGDYLARHGAPALQTALTTGQTDRPDGLFFAGTRPAWSQQVLREVLRRHGRSRARLGWIDVHTGLGPAGHGEKIYSGPDDAATLARTRAWWGADVTSIYDGTSTSAKVQGMLFNATLEECPGAAYAGIALEFGTLSFTDVLAALRARLWLANHPEADADRRESILRLHRDAFYIDTPAWKSMVFAQTRVAALQAMVALSANN